MIPLEIIPKAGIVTYTGKIVTPLNPDPETICIEDIAHSLANQCRFTGHTKEFYSVAQHSVLVSQLVPPEDVKWGVLHDASEAYLSDIARPIKQAEGLGETYLETEYLLMRAIAERFDLPPLPLPESVKRADNVMLDTEIKELMDFEPYGTEFFHIGYCWTPGYAENMFLTWWEMMS